MKTKALVRLIKRQERTPRATVPLAVGPKSWSKSVRSWIVEFQNNDRSEVLRAFDSLFKDGSAPLGGADGKLGAPQKRRDGTR
jgi:hypothetical protein